MIGRDIILDVIRCEARWTAPPFPEDGGVLLFVQSSVRCPTFFYSSVLAWLQPNGTGP